MEVVDSEDYRKKLWEAEYSGGMNVPSSRGFNESSSLRMFMQDYPDINKGYALDLGSGNGRNSIYLAKQGFKKVLGIELSSKAVDIANGKVKEEGLEDKISFINQSLSEDIPEKDSSFDLIIDMMTIHSLTKEARENMVREVKRLLKPHGFYLFFTMESNSSAAKKLIAENPGPEEGSYRFEHNGNAITEKTFTKDELISIFKPLKLIEFRSFEHTTKAFGGSYDRVYISGIMQK